MDDITMVAHGMDDLLLGDDMISRTTTLPICYDWTATMPELGPTGGSDDERTRRGAPPSPSRGRCRDRPAPTPPSTTGSPAARRPRRWTSTSRP